MTEAEWQRCDDPAAMLAFLGRRATERKLRLFAVACCRRVWHLLADERSRRAVEVGERFAEGAADKAELGRAYGVVGGARGPDAFGSALEAVRAAVCPPALFPWAASWAAQDAEKAVQYDAFCRDVFR